MELKTSNIWNEYYTEIFFFILKRVNNTDATHDVIQNVFVKVHNNLKTVKNASKIKSWVYQIARNEIINYYNTSNKTVELSNLDFDILEQVQYNNLCCFDKFIDQLPEKYKSVVTLVYYEGKKLSEVAETLALSLANVKARVRRSKEILKENFKACCKFDTDKNGKLIGEPNCISCD